MKKLSIAAALVLGMSVGAPSVASAYGYGHNPCQPVCQPVCRPVPPPQPVCRPVCQPVCQPVCDPCDPCRRSGLLGLGILGIL